MYRPAQNEIKCRPFGAMHDFFLWCSLTVLWYGSLELLGKKSHLASKYIA
jgi:hypothetical protein